MKTLAMFDNVNAASLPAGAGAYAGYVDGTWPDYDAICKRFPTLAAQGRVVPIATSVAHNARIADFEKGNDFTKENLPGWLALMRDKKFYEPGVYCSRDSLPIAGASFIADWTDVPHLVSGYPACQWTDAAGANDESLALEEFFPPVKSPLIATATIKLALDGLAWSIAGGPWA